MKIKLQAAWNSRVGTYRARVGKATGTAVQERLTRIRDRWAADVRVDTRHYRDTVEAAEPQMTSATSGTIGPQPMEDYFYYNEYGARTISARPSMRQAIEAERSDFTNTIDSILRDIGL
jgi:hypothetical protein